MIVHRIPDGVKRMSVERYILRAWPMLPGHAVRDLFKKKDVRLDGVRVTKETNVRGGQTLELFLPTRFEPAPAEIVYDDGRLIALVKPQGLPVDVDRDGIGADTLLTRIRVKYPKAELCHRLDAATGGLVLAAADPEILAQALEMFRTHTLRKKYVALVKDVPPEGEGILKAYLEKDAAKSRVRVIHHKAPGSKPIETRWALVDSRKGVSRVELEPVTGRTHQLRAHMADFGHPLLGDDSYGDYDFNKEHPGKLCLWCVSVEIGKDSPMELYRGRRFETPLPAWWREAGEVEA